MMPKNLVYVRHGQSQRNLAGKRAFEGDLSLFEEIINRPTSVALLSSEGEWQAKQTGLWLQRQGFNFQRWYTSSYNRAKQTAGLLNLPGSEWFVENNIRERSGGVLEDMTPDQRVQYLSKLRNRPHLLDLFNFRPDRGESYADVTIRWRLFLDTMHRECGDMDAVCVVNHGDNMWVAQSLHERWTPEDFVENRGIDAHGKIPNCMVLHYTRINPEDPHAEPVKYLGWVRSYCPWRDESPSSWRAIKRKRYSSQDLLEQVRQSEEFVRQAS